MPATTAKGYPYPLGTDRLMDGDDAIKNLATAMDTKSGVSASGVATVPVAVIGTPVSVTVTFPAGRFSTAPNVQVTAQATAPQNFAVGIGSGSITTTGVTIWGTKIAAGAAPFPVTWQARTA